MGIRVRLGLNNPLPGPRAPLSTRETKFYRRVIETPHRRPRPGTVRKTHLPMFAKRMLQPKIKGGLTVQEFFKKGYTNTNLLRANVNLNKIRETVKILKDPKNFYKSLSIRNQFLFKLAKVRGRLGQFVHSKL